MKTLILSIALIAGLVYAGTVVEIPAHNQNISLWRAVIDLPDKDTFSVTAYYTGATGKMAPRTISKKAIGTYDKVMAYFIKQFMEADVALQGYKIVGEVSDYDTTGITVTEKTSVEGEGEEAISIKTITIRQVL